MCDDNLIYYVACPPWTSQHRLERLGSMRIASAPRLNASTSFDAAVSPRKPSWRALDEGAAAAAMEERRDFHSRRVRIRIPARSLAAIGLCVPRPTP